MFALRFAWRDSRGSRRRLLLFVSAMALGVAALVAIESFSDRLAASVEAQARELAGADLNVYGRRVLTREDEAYLDSLRAATGAETARELVFTSMAFFPARGASRLVQVRALDGAYPFYGAIRTDPPEAAATYQARGEALVEASLLLQFDVAVGDTVRIGERHYRIAGRIEGVTGQPDIGAFVAPRVYVPLEGLDPALTAPGARVESNTYFRLPEGMSAEALREAEAARLEAAVLRAWTAESVQADWSDGFQTMGRFLALVGFVALLLGGLGVASAVTVYVRQKTETVATLRCLGSGAGQGMAAYAAQAALLGTAAALLGAGLGLLVQAALPAVLRPFLPVEVPALGVSWRAVGVGFGVGLATALAFALLPLLRVRRIPPLAALRPEEARRGGTDPLRGLVGLALALGVGLFAWAQTGDLRAAAAFPAGLALALGMLTAVAFAVMWLARRAVPPGLSYVWRQGLANLYRPGNQTLVLLLTLGLGTGLLLTLYVVQATLLGRIAVPGSDTERPGLILFDVQPGQTEAVASVVHEAGGEVLQHVPVVSMRIAALDGVPVADLETGDGTGRAGWALRREYRSTYRATLLDSERLVAGRFTGRVAPDAEVVPVSLSTDVAEELGVDLGSRITWNVGGVELESVVESLREVDWARVQPNFFALFPEGPLEAAPQFQILLARAPSPDAEAAVQRAVVAAFPHVSVVDVRLALDLIEGVLGRVAFVLQFMALFSLGTGLVVLAGAVRVAQLERVEEAALLRTLGADRGQVRRILLAEYALLGLLAAVVGVALALAASGVLAHAVFRAPLVPAWGALGLAVVGVPALTLLVGWAGSRGVLRRPPLAVLRAEG